MPASVEVKEPDLCRTWLSSVRHVAKQSNGWTDKGCDVLDNGGDYYVVEDQHGKFVWEGKAHCRWCARASAISKLSGAS